MFLPIQKAMHKDVNSVGRKAQLFAQLSEVMSVPFSLVLQSDIYQAFLQHNNLEEKLEHITAETADSKTLASQFLAIAQLFEAASFPNNIIAELKECFELALLDTTNLHELGKKTDAVLMLHRSTNYEDTDTICPGTIYTNDSFDEFLRSIKSCLLSAYTPSSIACRKAKNESSFSMGIIVSRMPPPQTCLSSTFSSHKKTISIKSYKGFPDNTNTVPKDTFILDVDFLRITQTDIVEQSIVTIFDKVANQVQQRKYAPGGSAQTVPDQTILEVGRLTKKISNQTKEKNFIAEFIVDETEIITCFDMKLCPSQHENNSATDTIEKENETTPPVEEIQGGRELAKALISFLAKHKFSKFGPALQVVIRSLENEVNPSTLKQGVMMVKELLDEKD